MAIDKDLFLYDLAVVAIMKNEAPYVKEWLDYHILAGVDHFYIFDNESPDNFKEVLQPYIDAGIVTYKFYPGTGRQIEAYTEAFKAYRFFCRYMAFIDADEFIFPQNNKSIVEVADEILKENPTSSSLLVSWIMYGSNNLEKADYSKGVLERFTRRSKKLEMTVKTIADPRKIFYMTTPHYFNYFLGYNNFGERTPEEKRGLAEKIFINHYRLKSREEFLNKNNKFVGDVAYGNKDYYNANKFTHEKNNEVFDDRILKYRNERKKNYGGNVRQIDYRKLENALIKNLSPIFEKKLSHEFFEDQMETFLVCRALAQYLDEKSFDKQNISIIENAALNAINITLQTDIDIADVEIFLSELPNILPRNYPVVKNIRESTLEIIPKIKNVFKMLINEDKKRSLWRNFYYYDSILSLLKGFETYHK